MNTEQIMCCVVALILGMLMANMFKSVCGCKVVEGAGLHVGGDTTCEGGANCDIGGELDTSNLNLTGTSTTHLGSDSTENVSGNLDVQGNATLIQDTK